MGGVLVETPWLDKCSNDKEELISRIEAADKDLTSPVNLQLSVEPFAFGLLEHVKLLEHMAMELLSEEEEIPKRMLRLVRHFNEMIELAHSGGRLAARRCDPEDLLNYGYDPIDVLRILLDV